MLDSHRGWFGVLLPALALAGVVFSSQGSEAPMVAQVRAMEADTNEARRDALEDILRGLGLDFERGTFTIAARAGYPRTEGTNLIVTIGEGGPHLVVGAHYDAAWLSGGVLSRGAIDNASSSVILAHLAAALSRDPPERPVRVVFFDMEEIGLVGSRKFIEAYGTHTIRAAVNLDVNGYGDTVFYGPSSAAGNESLYVLMREHCRSGLVACLEFPAYPASDYQSFQAAGIPNISLSILPSGEAGQFRQFLVGDRASLPGDFVPRVLELIHSPMDTGDRVEEAALLLGLRSLEAFVRLLDGSATSVPVSAESPTPD